MPLDGMPCGPGLGCRDAVLCRGVERWLVMMPHWLRASDAKMPRYALAGMPRNVLSGMPRNVLAGMPRYALAGMPRTDLSGMPRHVWV